MGCPDSRTTGVRVRDQNQAALSTRARYSGFRDWRLWSAGKRSGRSPRRRSRRSLHYPGSRSASIMPTLWALWAFLGGVIVLLAVLTAANMDTPTERPEAPTVSSTAVPGKPAAPPTPCFPFQGPC